MPLRLGTVKHASRGPAVVGLAAKILTGLGAAILLAAGGCFLFLSSALGRGSPSLSTVTIVLLVGGVLCAIAFVGLFRNGS